MNSYVWRVLVALLLIGAHALPAQQIGHKGQPLSGPGGASYAHGEVRFGDYASHPDGYWLFEPAAPRPDSAHVVVFLHGYGAYNPMIYGKWIKHLVAKGNIVIYPRYQKNLLSPRAARFPELAAEGIRSALRELGTGDHVRPRLDGVSYIGHSYGGAIAANLGVNWVEHAIPKPASMLLCEPGTGPLKGSRLPEYSGLPADLHLVVVVGEDDEVVGDEFGRLVFETATATPRRNLVIQCHDTLGRHWLWATHLEPYSCDPDFDTGLRNYTATRALYSSRLNAVDFYCYWKLADALMSGSREGRDLEYAFGATRWQRSMGLWYDGTELQWLDVEVPDGVSPTGLPAKARSATSK